MTNELTKILLDNNIDDIYIEEVNELEEKQVLISTLFINNEKVAVLTSDSNKILLEKTKMINKELWNTLERCFENKNDKLKINNELKYDLDLFLFELIDKYYMVQEISDFNNYIIANSKKNTFFRLTDKEYAISECQGLKGNFEDKETLEIFILLLADNDIEEIYIFDINVKEFKLFNIVTLNEKIEKNLGE